MSPEGILQNQWSFQYITTLLVLSMRRCMLFNMNFTKALHADFTFLITYLLTNATNSLRHLTSQCVYILYKVRWNFFSKKLQSVEFLKFRHIKRN
jgi:hypothetical protein